MPSTNRISDSTSRQSVSSVVMTVGEPAGIGPDLALAMADIELPGEFVVLGDRDVLANRASALGLDVTLRDVTGDLHTLGSIAVEHLPCPSDVTAGRLNPENGGAVMASIDRAVDDCVAGRFGAMVTGPLQKSVIIEAPVMLLASDDLRVALVTTHLPLSEVSAAITPDRITAVTRVLAHDLEHVFGIQDPVIGVCGLNPHAGEAGHLGREEIEIIEPTLDRLRDEGLNLQGPLPADTAFTPGGLEGLDAVLAMYHDQGLPVIKHHGFDKAVNVTLGLPIVRTSVDHGTALDLAASGRADAGSLIAATRLAFSLATRRQKP